MDGKDGWSTYGLSLIDEVMALGMEVRIISSKNSKKSNEKSSFLYFLKPPKDYLLNIFNCFSASRKIRVVIEEFNPDIIHFVVEPYSNILLFLRRNKKEKYILTVHGTYSYIPELFDNPIKKIVSALICGVVFNSIDKIIAVSNFTSNYLKSKAPYLRDKIIVIKNGIKINKNARTVKQEGGVKKITYIGAVKPRKGLYEAVEALGIFKQNSNTPFIFNIIGSYHGGDSYYEKILNKIKINKLEENIKFLGRVSDEEKNSLLSDSDLFIMTSINNGKDFEGFGLVYLEANSFGVPCIGPNDSGAVDAIMEGVSGFVVNPRNSREICDKVDFIINKKAIKREDCVDWAKKNDIKNRILETVEVYKDINNNN